MNYWATKKTEELVGELSERVKHFHGYLRKTGLGQKWRRSQDLYFGKHLNETGVGSATIHDSGDVGELKVFAVNRYRNNIKHVMALTTSQRPAFDPRAKNSDVESQQQTRLANQILDSYLSEKRLGRHMALAAERSLVGSKGFVYMCWDVTQGKPYAPAPVKDKDGNPVLDENGEPVEKILYEGDVSAKSKGPFDVIYDPLVREWQDNKWVIVREWKNKYDVAARYPEKADAILKLTSQDSLDEFKDGVMSRFGIDDDTKFNDYIPCYYFYHIKTDAMPSGRYITFLNDNIALFDGAMPYRRLPVFRITPGEIFDTAEGYSDAFDTMALQEVLNTLYSIPFTNQQAFGVQTIWMPDGCDVDASQVGKGLVILKGGPPEARPQPLQLTQTPAEIFKNIEFVEKKQDELHGLNSVIKGDPEHNLKSGAALGRVQAMAIQFASNFQKSWAELQEDCGTFLLELLQDFAKTERMMALAGKSNKNAMISFSGKDLNQIDRVNVDLGNPLTRTVAGRLEFADNLFEKGEINGKQYIQVATTGQLDSIYESKESGVDLIKKENEMLLEGKAPKALVSDRHMDHITEHQTVTNDPYLRERASMGDQKAASILQATLAHIQEHFDFVGTPGMAQHALWAMLKGEPPPPMIPPPMPPPGSAGALPPPPGEEAAQGGPPIPPPGPEIASPPPIPPVGPLPEPNVMPQAAV